MTTSNIPLTLRDASGCSCCSPAGTAAVEATEDSSSATATYGVLGLTCGGCASCVAASLMELDGVLDARVSAVPGGISTAVVVGSRPVADTAVAEAVSRAGYRLAETSRDVAQGSEGCCAD